MKNETLISVLAVLMMAIIVLFFWHNEDRNTELKQSKLIYTLALRLTTLEKHLDLTFQEPQESIEPAKYYETPKRCRG